MQVKDFFILYLLQRNFLNNHNNIEDVRKMAEEKNYQADPNYKDLKAFQEKSNEFKKKLRQAGIKNYILHRDPGNGIPHTIIYLLDDIEENDKSYIDATTEQKDALCPSLHHEKAPSGVFAKTKSAFLFDTEENLQRILLDQPSPFVTKTFFEATDEALPKEQMLQTKRDYATKKSIMKGAQITQDLKGCPVFIIEYNSRQKHKNGSYVKKCIIIEPRCMGENVEDYFYSPKRPKFTWETLTKFMGACLVALRDFHKHHRDYETHKTYCVHSDIKPQNLFYDDKTGTIELIDFGSSFYEGDPYPGVFTRFYAAPEQLNPNSSRIIDGKADVFSMSHVIQDFAGRAIDDITTKAIQDLGESGLVSGGGLRHEAMREAIRKAQAMQDDPLYLLIKRMNNADHDDRPTAEEALAQFDQIIAKKYPPLNQPPENEKRQYANVEILVDESGIRKQEFFSAPNKSGGETSVAGVRKENDLPEWKEDSIMPSPVAPSPLVAQKIIEQPARSSEVLNSKAAGSENGLLAMCLFFSGQQDINLYEQDIAPTQSSECYLIK